jgi:hypothetical protein
MLELAGGAIVCHAPGLSSRHDAHVLCMSAFTNDFEHLRPPTRFGRLRNNPEFPGSDPYFSRHSGRILRYCFG